MAEARVVRAHRAGAVAEATTVLQQGGLVAIPTDTVYGLAADLWNAEAVERIYAVKRRSERKAIPVLLAAVEDLPKVIQPPPGFVRELARRFWPGPLTIVLARRAEVPEAVSPTDTLGVRVPDQAFALELLATAGSLAVTSANRSGGRSACTADEVLAELGDSIDLVVDGGRTPGGLPSTVLDCSHAPPRVLREGPISWGKIESVLQGERAARAGPR